MGTQTPGWRAAGAQVVPSGLVLGTVVEPAALSLSNPSNENIIGNLIISLIQVGIHTAFHLHQYLDLI